MRVPILVLFIVLLVATAPSLGQIANDSSEEALVAVNSTPDLSYIWSVTGIEPGPIIMALKQDGSDIYGAAKYEPENGRPWNAVVIGSIDRNEVYLVLTHLQNSTLISSKITGSYDAINQSMQGELVQVSNDKILKRGRFDALWINPDISSFIPATIEEAKPVTLAPQIKKQTSQETVQQTSRFHDVHQNSDIIMTGVCSSGLS